MADADDARVEVTREDHLLVVRMVRGAKRNAVDRKMADALDAALSELDDDDALWAGILTGTDQIFCAGSDLRSNGDYVTERGGEYAAESVRASCNCQVGHFGLEGWASVRHRFAAWGSSSGTMHGSFTEPPLSRAVTGCRSRPFATGPLRGGPKLEVPSHGWARRCAPPGPQISS